MKSWNHTYHALTDIDPARNKVSWDEERPAAGTTLHIEAVRNGFILDIPSSCTREVFTSHWELSNRVRELLIRTVRREEDFVLSDYDEDVAKNLGLSREEQP